MATRHLGHQVGRCRCDDDQVRLAREADVADLALVVEIKQVGEHALVGQRCNRQRRDELLRRLCHHRAHAEATLARPTDQVETFVGRDAAADDEQDTF